MLSCFISPTVIWPLCRHSSNLLQSLNDQMIPQRSFFLFAYLKNLHIFNVCTKKTTSFFIACLPTNMWIISLCRTERETRLNKWNINSWSDGCNKRRKPLIEFFLIQSVNLIDFGFELRKKQSSTLYWRPLYWK